MTFWQGLRWGFGCGIRLVLVLVVWGLVVVVVVHP